MAGVSRGRSRLKGDGRPEKAREARAAGGGGGGPHHMGNNEVGRSLPVEEQHDLFLMHTIIASVTRVPEDLSADFFN